MQSTRIVTEAICPECGQEWEITFELGVKRNGQTVKGRLKCPNCGRRFAIIVAANGAAQPGY
jgi:transcriptional regulator NrdR family protein